MDERKLSREQIGVLSALKRRPAPHGQLNTRSLRVLEERGFVGFAIGRRYWWLKKRGHEALERTNDDG